MRKETTLKLADDLIPLLDEGIKEITIREGIRYFEDEITIANRPVLIDSVEHIKFKDVPMYVLWQDGFESFSDALNGMRKYYPNLAEDCIVTVIRFHLKANDSKGNKG